MENSVIIRSLAPADEAGWRELWAAYCAFYGQDVAQSVTENLWARLMGGDFVTRGIVAEGETGVLLGFAHTVSHPHTWSDKTLLYLEDLYVATEARGRSVGHALISHLVEHAQTSGYARVYWHTETGNVAARRLYDRFTEADDFVRYMVTIPEASAKTTDGQTQCA